MARGSPWEEAVTFVVSGAACPHSLSLTFALSRACVLTFVVSGATCPQSLSLFP